MNQTISNLTTLSAAVLSWTFAPAISVAFLFIGWLTNGSVWVMFLIHSNLRTSFNFYLMNLLSANLLYLTFKTPLDIINTLYSRWWLGEKFCTYWIYTTYVLGAGIFNGHLLITLNRIWAFALPLSYKRHNTIRVAGFICFAMWVYVHIFTLPGVILDAKYYRLAPEVYGCFINPGPQYGWVVADQFLMFNTPNIIVLAAYPFLWYKRRQRNKVFWQMSSQQGAHMSSQHQKTQQTGAETSTVTVTVPVVVVPAKKTVKSASKEHSNAFMILTLLTISVLITWTPSSVFYTLLVMVGGEFPTFYYIITVSFAFEPLLDPLFFTIALKDLRDAFRKTFRWN